MIVTRLFSVFLLGFALLIPLSLSALAQPRTDFYGPGDSGAYYDFYLDWMSPRVKPKSPRVIQFLTRKASQVEEQALSSSQ